MSDDSIIILEERSNDPFSSKVEDPTKDLLINSKSKQR